MAHYSRIGRVGFPLFVFLPLDIFHFAFLLIGLERDHDTVPNKSVQATRDGRSSSASRFYVLWPRVPGRVTLVSDYTRDAFGNREFGIQYPTNVVLAAVEATEEAVAFTPAQGSIVLKCYLDSGRVVYY